MKRALFAVLGLLSGVAVVRRWRASSAEADLWREATREPAPPGPE